LPDLHDIVFGHTADDPGVVRVPAEVRDLGSVTSVDEEKFWRSVLSVLGALLFSNLRKIPDVEPSVGARAGQDRLIMRRPLDLGVGMEVVS